MKILLAGCLGQLGKTIQEIGTRHELVAPSEQEFNITDWKATTAVVRAVRPDVVINAAAYTDVDGSESKPDLAYTVNALGPRYLASACQEYGASLVHVSTNCVFDGEATTPYFESDPVHPVSVYGSSKLAGEEAVRAVLPRHYIVRTAWLYSLHGRNFPKTIIRLAKERDRLPMVDDEVSSPTYAPDFARAILELVERPIYGIYHFTNAGECSRLAFAREILRLAGREEFPLDPMSLRDYARPSRPPLYSPLRNFAGASIGIALRPWQDALAEAVPLLEA